MDSTISSTRLGVCGLLEALRTGWQAYLPALATLESDALREYLARQGYDRPRDLLAHVTAWGEETLGVVPVLLRGGAIQRYDEDAFNAQAIARFSHFSSAEVEHRFVQTYAALSRLLALLPDSALDQPAVYDWLHTTIVGHFGEHRLPNVPPLA